MTDRRVPAVIVSCEHASPDVPVGIDLGLPADIVAGHLGWDEGAAEIAAVLGQLCRSTPILGTVSRLVVDLNRSADNPQVIPTESFGVRVPGNVTLTAEAQLDRLLAYHWPYRRRLTRAIGHAIAVHQRCVHLSVHSFDPALEPGARDFDAGVLFDPERAREAAIAGRLIADLTAAGFAARANQPYLGTADGATTAMRIRFADELYAGLELETALPLARDRTRADALARAVARSVEEAIVADAVR